MRKALLLAALALMVTGYLASPAVAQDEGEKKLTFNGEIRSRFEYNVNYFDFSDSDLLADPDADAFSFWPYRFRLSATAALTDNVKAFAEIQNASTFGQFDFFDYLDYGFPTRNPTPDFSSMLPYVGDYPAAHSGYFFPFGEIPFTRFHVEGATNDGGISGRETRFYQGYVDLQKLGGTDLALRVGRQELTYGTQLLVGNLEFYTGQSFDGARLMWDGEKYGFNAFYYKLNEFFHHTTDTNFFGATGNYNFGKQLGSVGAYFMTVQEFDVTAKVDTYGVRWGRMVNSVDDMREGPFDWNAEFAAQSGDVGSGEFKQSLSGNIFEGWFGWNFGTGSGRSRVHVGALLASGDKNPDDNKFKGFVPLFGDIHVYNRLGDLDIFGPSNIVDYNLGYSFSTAEDRHTFFVAGHKFALAEKVTEPDGSEADNLGTEIDLGYSFRWNPVTSFEVGIAQLLPGEVEDWIVREETEDLSASADTVQRYWAQVRVRW